MDNTPKTDILIAQLNVCIWNIKAGKYNLKSELIERPNTAQKIVEGLKFAFESIRDIGITTDDIKNEYWTICPNLNELPNYIAILGTRFDKTELYDDWEDYHEMNDMWNLEKSGIISRSEASDMFAYFNLLADCLFLWREGIKGIISDFREIVSNAQRESDNQKQKSISKRNIPIKQKLCTNEAKDLFYKINYH